MDVLLCIMQLFGPNIVGSCPLCPFNSARHGARNFENPQTTKPLKTLNPKSHDQAHKAFRNSYRVLSIFREGQPPTRLSTPGIEALLRGNSLERILAAEFFKAPFDKSGSKLREILAQANHLW